MAPRAAGGGGGGGGGEALSSWVRRCGRAVGRPWLVTSRLAVLLAVLFVVFGVQQFLATERENSNTANGAGVYTKVRNLPGARFKPAAGAGAGGGAGAAAAAAAGAGAAGAGKGKEASKSLWQRWSEAWGGAKPAPTRAGALAARFATLPPRDVPNAGAGGVAAATAAAAVRAGDDGGPAADVAALQAKIAALGEQLEAVRKRRDEQLGLLAAVDVARANFEDEEASRQLTPKQTFRKLQRTLIARTQETIATQEYLNKLHSEIERLLASDRGSQSCRPMHIGSYSQGWAVSEALLVGSPTETDVFSFGIGKELSFDLDLIAAFVAEKRDVRLHAFDPDARSIEWAERQRLTKRLILHEVGLAKEDGPMDFWQLARRSGTSLDNHFSKTREEDIKVSVTGKTLSTLRKELDVGRLELLKLDIEGLEFSLASQLTPAVVNASHLLIDMHTGTNDVVADVYTSATAALNTLIDSGWRLLAVDERHGRKFTFVQVCSRQNTASGRGDCLCCYPDVPIACVLAR